MIRILQKKSLIQSSQFSPQSYLWDMPASSPQRVSAYYPHLAARKGYSGITRNFSPQQGSFLGLPASSARKWGVWDYPQAARKGSLGNYPQCSLQRISGITKIAFKQKGQKWDYPQAARKGSLGLRPTSAFAPAKGLWDCPQAAHNPRSHNGITRHVDIARKEKLLMGLPASSPQRVSGIAKVKQPTKGLWDYPQAARKGSLGLPASRKVCPKGFSCLGHFSPFLGVICVIGVSSGLSFAIDHAKWNIDFLSTSVLICRRNTLRMPALLLSGVKILSMYIL